MIQPPSVQASKPTADFIAQYGWTRLNGIYTTGDIAKARAIFDEMFQPGAVQRSSSDSDHIINDIYRHRPELGRIIFNEKYFAGVRSLLGEDIVWLPECAIHRDRYAKWHKDTTEQEIGGITSHIEEPSPMLQVSTYLQDYSPEDGGGISVVPASHRKPDRFMDMYQFDILSRIKRKVARAMGQTVFQKIEKNKEFVDIPSKATDLAVFDIRTEHRASSPIKQPSLIKYSIFNTFGNNTKALKDYYGFMKQRPEPYYVYYKNYKAPDIIFEIAKENNVVVWD